MAKRYTGYINKITNWVNEVNYELWIQRGREREEEEEGREGNRQTDGECQMRAASETRTWPITGAET